MNDIEAALDDDVGDDLLRLVFISCHPVLSTEARVALTLRLLGGLTTDEIARAFLVPEPTVAQRIVRAKRTLSEARVPFEVPRGTDLAARLSSVLAVIYLVFNEGYAATAGDDWLRPALCEEALRLGRILAELAPREPEVHGLVALMEIQASRSRARVGPSGEPILLLDQNRAHWDQLLIRRGLAALERSEKLRARSSTRRGARTCCRLRSPPVTRGRELRTKRTGRASSSFTPSSRRVTPSPVVELNRAVAVAMAFGPAAGLELVDALTSEPSLRELSPVAQRARRLPQKTWPAGRSPRRVRTRRRAHAQRTRTRVASGTRPGMRLSLAEHEVPHPLFANFAKRGWGF